MPVSNTRKRGRKAAEKVVQSRWVEWLVRFGYLVRGALYLLVGLIAIQVALGGRGSTEGKTGALAEISAQPFGKILLICMAVGLAGYSLWGLVRALLDPLGKGTSAKGLVERGGYIVSALSYGALLVPTISLIRGSGAGEESARIGTAFALSQPLGHWLVLLAGVVAIGGALGQVYTGITARFEKDFKRSKMSAHEFKVAMIAGRLGHIARGIVFGLIGLFLIQAALEDDPGQAQGLDGALAAIAGGDKGLVSLAMVAVGLVAFGVYSILCTRWIKLAKHES